MSANVMTAIGALCAMLAFVQAGLPFETNMYIKLSIGAINAALAYYLGHTNQGTVNR